MSTTVTPNVGLQIPAFNQGNWNVPFNYNWNLLDLIFGGTVVVPAMHITVLTADNMNALVGGLVTSEVPSGAQPGSTFTLSNNAQSMLLICVNGIVQRGAGVSPDYTVAGKTVTFNYTIGATDVVTAVYIKGA